MSDSNPFAEKNRPPKQPGEAAKLPWIIAGVAVIVAIAMILLWSSGRVDRSDLESVRAELENSKTNLANAQAETQKAQEQITALKSQIADLEKQRDFVANSSKALEDEMRSKLESKDVTIQKLQGKLTVSIVDSIMFDSGEAILKPDGQGVMQRVASILSGHPELKIHVIGHTDNIPIRANARSRFASNWELSTARATAAVHFLTEQAGVDPRRVGAVGYGEFRPVADNATPEGRAKNRRIAITILPDELSTTDTNAPLNAATPTNSVSPAPPQ